MRTAYRIASTAVAVGAIFPLGTLPAHADTSPVKVEGSAWFWSGQTSGTLPNGMPIPNVPVESATGVKKGQLAVGFKGETETTESGDTITKPDKETYLRWDVYFVPEGSYVDSFTFTVFLDPTAKQVFLPQEVKVDTQQPRGGQPPLVACLPTIGFGDGEGDAFAVKPGDDCSTPLYGEFDAKTQSYTFDASSYAQDWVDGKDNHGLGIRPALDENDPFQLVLKGAESVTATMTYTPKEPEPVAPTVDPVVPLPVAPPVVAPPVFVPNLQPQPQPQPQPAPLPVVQTTRKPVVTRNVAASPLTATRGLNPVFWLALVGGVLLIGTTSLILGDPLEAVVGGRNRVRTTGRHRLNVPAGVPVRTTRPVRPRTV